MNVLIDYHHTDLAESLHRLFERMGFTVYVPDGMEWFEQDIWRQGWQLAGDAIARQFLLAPTVDDLNPKRTLNRVSLEEARGMDWDVICATVPDNYDGYRRFARDKGAVFVIEVGNVNQPVDAADLILDSTGVIPAGIRFTPEFDMEGAFAYQKPHRWKLAASFVNLFPLLPCFPLFQEAQTLLHDDPDWAVAVYGHNGPAGFIKPTSAIGERMGANDFGWQDKITGDGFGYVIHYWASVGRPLIGHGSHYRGQQAEWMWDDLVTCIDLDKHSISDTAKLMQSLIKTDRLEEMGETLATRLRERVDFATDAERVADALGLAVAA